jgi:predicted flap endonuclease-1-like 5' DNA nuclease
MNDAAWWARVVQTRTERDDPRPQRVLDAAQGRARRRDDLKAVPGIGAEIVLTVDGELRKTPLFRSHQQAELVAAIADTRTAFEGKGWT